MWDLFTRPEEYKDRLHTNKYKAFKSALKAHSRCWMDYTQSMALLERNRNQDISVLTGHYVADLSRLNHLFGFQTHI